MSRIKEWGLAFLWLMGLPFLGFLLSGQPWQVLMEFPPVTTTVDHAPFSWTAFGLFSLVAGGAIAGLGFLLFGGSPTDIPPKKRGLLYPYPWWGWMGLVSLGIFWCLAWTRFPWFAEYQGYTFTPLWLSFIVVLNAWTYHRSGRCLLLDHPTFFLSLFIWSAGFWWYFEYLNRFVQNWRYIGIEPMTPLSYIFHSTLAFSTVLPAVWSACTFLQTLPFFTKRPFSQPLSLPQQAKFGWGLLAVGGICLLGLPLWPNYFFPVLWMGPLLVLLGIQVTGRQRTLFSALEQGQWQVIAIPACASLFCGFFWEMWNMYSAAKWEYTIPFVDRFHIFEMPILGYAGYLPFGLECVVVVDFLTRGRHRLDIIGWSNNRG